MSAASTPTLPSAESEAIHPSHHGTLKKPVEWPFVVTCNRGLDGHDSRGTVFAESAFSEAFVQNRVVNYKNVLIRCHKKKVNTKIYPILTNSPSLSINSIIFALSHPKWRHFLRNNKELMGLWTLIMITLLYTSDFSIWFTPAAPPFRILLICWFFISWSIFH